jgi:hypothetical protein
MNLRALSQAKAATLAALAALGLGKKPARRGPERHRGAKARRIARRRVRNRIARRSRARNAR